VPIRIMVERVCHRVRQGVWGESGFSRQRQGHWIRALKKNIRTYLGLWFEGDIMEGFHELLHALRYPMMRLA